MKELLEKIKHLLGSVTLEEAKKKELEQQLQQLEQATREPAPRKSEPQENKNDDVITALQSEITALKQLMIEQKERAEKAEKAMQDRLAAERKKMIDDYKKEIIEVKKILSPAEFKEKWEGLLEKDFEGVKKILDTMPVHPAVKDGKQHGQAQKADGGGKEKIAGPIGGVNPNILNKVLEFSNNN